MQQVWEDEILKARKFYKHGTIIAEQFDGSEEMAERYGIQEYVRAMHQTEDGPKEQDSAQIKTLEGWLDIEIGNWIATGVNGEHWPIADDIFSKTYKLMPVIPQTVGEYIKWGKTYGIPTYMMFSFKFVRAQGFSKLTDEVEDWIISNSDAFATAWLLG